MKPDNYMSFSIVIGFFLGLAFAIAKFDNPIFMLLWTIIAMMGTYLVCVFCIALLFKNTDFEISKQKKENLEREIEMFRKELDKQERSSKSIREFIKSIETDVEDELIKAKEG